MWYFAAPQIIFRDVIASQAISIGQNEKRDEINSVIQ
jgi:hypothetical protein